MNLAGDQGRSARMIAKLAGPPSESDYLALHALISEAEKLSDSDSPRLDEIIQTINSTTPLDTDRAYFAGLHGWCSPEELAQCWAAPLPEPVPDLADAELLAVIAATKMHTATPKIDRFLWFLRQSLGRAFSSDLIFWPYGDWTDSQLVGEIRTRKALLASGGEEALAAYEIAVAQEIIRDAESPPPRTLWAERRIRSSQQSQRSM